MNEHNYFKYIKQIPLINSWMVACCDNYFWLMMRRLIAISSLTYFFPTSISIFHYILSYFNNWYLLPVALFFSHKICSGSYIYHLCWWVNNFFFQTGNIPTFKKKSLMSSHGVLHGVLFVMVMAVLQKKINWTNPLPILFKECLEAGKIN